MIEGQLSRAVTRDGLEMVGFAALPGRCDTGLLHVHGLDGNFYENRFVDAAAQACRDAGVAFLSGNTRGHDYIADNIRTDAQGNFDYVRIGGMFERLRDCVEDIGAWTGWLRGSGCRRIILQGHSHGAIKVLHYLTTAKDSAVCGLVLLSPSDDLGLARARLGDHFEEAVRLTAELVRTGRERTLMPEELFPYPTSAGAFLDTLGPDSLALAFNLSRTDRKTFPELNSVRVPVLLVLGTEQEACVQAPQEYADAIGRELTSAPSFETVIISGAPHNYLGFESQVHDALSQWLKALEKNHGCRKDGT